MNNEAHTGCLTRMTRSAASLGAKLSATVMLGTHLLAGPISAQRAGEALALVGGRLVSSPDVANPIENGIVVVIDGRVAAIGSNKTVTIPPGAATLDCKGLVVVAGFQNSHIHFAGQLWTDAGKRSASELGASLAEMLLRYGFTTVVETAGDLGNTNALRARIESLEVTGPRILTAGPGLYPPRGVPYYIRDVAPAEILRLLPQPETAQSARQVVQQQITAGADIVKLFTGSWVERRPQGVVPMPEDVASAAVEEAHRAGRLVFSHPSNVAGLEVALRARVDVLAHVVEDTKGLTAQHLARMKRSNIGLVPTLKLLRDVDTLDQVRSYARAGGQILFGTDVGFLEDFDPADEYQLMGSAGLGWREILASLTTNPANRFRESHQRGRLVPGMEADLVVLGTDPWLGAKAFTDVRYTIRKGRVVYQAKPR
jgi:imidazolonepropionase-like amidohydrolase